MTTPGGTISVMEGIIDGLMCNFNAQVEKYKIQSNRKAIINTENGGGSLMDQNVPKRSGEEGLLPIFFNGGETR